jgi:hypothetical protein
MSRAPKIVLLGVLFAALLLEGAVLYFMEDRTTRLYVGLGLFLLVGWMLASPQMEEVIREMPERIRQRKYPRMRQQVQLLLAEVRRLNWMAVDGHRGFRNRDEAVAEMDAIEERMKDLVRNIRLEAGVESEPDQESKPGEPPLSDETPAPGEPPVSREPPVSGEPPAPGEPPERRE